ncbi:MAG TPA: Calx-beta domain-containing protein [Dehalococcoidia bacterium]|nr:Calx-beta domain-containing protein [Dehalococcoidia bacterium]
MVVSNIGGQIQVRRTDGFSWADDGYAAGQWIQIGAEANTHKIVGFEDFTCAPPPPGETQIPNCGAGSVMLLDGAAGATGAFTEGHVHVSEPLKVVSNDPTLAISTSAITRDSGSWLADGFFVGQQVWISGMAGAWTVTSLTPTVMTLSGAALTPTYHLDSAGVFVMDFVPLQVTGYDVTKDGGVRMGGDTLVVCNPNVQPVCTQDSVVGGPHSPLVLFGDTSQDGVWYSGHSYDIYGYEFGEKPFDPFVNLPDGDNEDDEWVFPLANPFAYHGNDVIDASGLFAWIDCSASCTLPTVGVTAYGGPGDDLIFGSQTGDHLAGGSGDDEIVGNRGVDHIYGDSGFNVNVLTRGLFVTHVDASPLPTIDLEIIRFTMEGETIAPYPSPVRDLLGGGDDIICGDANTECRSGLVAMNPAGAETLFEDIVFGDKGEVFQHVIDPNTPNTLLQKIQTTLLQSALSIESRDYQRGGDDVIFGNLGRDVLVGGTGHDMADGDEADDLLFGDNVFLFRRVASGRLAVDQTDKPLPGEPGFDGDITSGRFQTLCGTLLYSRTDRPNACGGLVTQDNSGLLLVDDVWRDYRDPDAVPWWAEYLVAFDDDFSDNDPFHTFEVQNGDKAVGSFGNDYLAGGQAHDMLFGQMGNDVLQGDGEIERAFARRVEDTGPTAHAGASRTPAGCVGTAGVNLVCDYVGPLTIVPAVESMTTDGQDYIEGNAGDDIVFGGLGQDDIVGGSSDFFSLSAANDLLAPPGDHTKYPGAELRPDGRDLLFGGAGTRAGRNDNSCLGQTTQTADVPCAGGLDVTYNADADTMIGDNGRIIRIVGLNHVDGAGVTAPNKYVTFDYDDYGAMRLVVRGVHLLDYTPGGPDFDPERFGLTQGDGPCSASPYTGVCSTPISSCAGSASPYADVGGHDEVHGEAGSDTAYGGCGNDVLYGDAQDDDLIGGWGNDWISGGTGQDGVIGDDGRIFTSKNRACLGAASSVPCAVETEPLYGILGFRTVDPDSRTSQGDVLNEFIYTPGQVQTATINVAGALKKEVDISPYNLGPNFVAGHFQVDLPLFDANNSDDVIFGGWDDDFLHGAAGDDAISGAEAMEASFVQHFSGPAGGQDAQQSGGAPDGVIHVDWNRPYNPGNLLLFGADVDPWNSPKPMVRRLGEFYLYDEYDARRAILFDGAGKTWGCTSFSPSGHVCTGNPPVSSFPYRFFLNLTETSKLDGTYTVLMTEGRITPSGCIDVSPNGTCLKFTTVRTDGNDRLFGDLGNDWVVGGSGNDDIWGGWGNDLLNGDDILTTNGSLNDAPDTHPTYEDRIYGGAGLDILIINTGGDRAIDWVGEFNSYIAPFAPFGIKSVSRQVEPQLPEFLYALSQSDGADPTRDYDTGRVVTDPGRNGEYEGEIGLIIQQDHGYWQEQTGGPTDPQAGNIPGGRRDVLGGADFNSGSLGTFAVDSGVFEILNGALAVSASSLGQDAAAVFYGDAYLPIYYEIEANVMVQKPTAGWKANAYLIFDYFSATDFKFAGIDVSTNKMVIGHRTPAGWIIDAQAPFTGSLKSDTLYRQLIAVNGTVVTVSVNGTQALSYTYGPRTLNGQSVGLNKGLIGVGSDNSRGVYDNVLVKALPPEVTLDSTEYFEDGTADQFTGFETGAWSVSGGRYYGAPAGSLYALDTLDPGSRIRANSYVGVEAVLSVSGAGGLAFDIYDRNDFKFAVLDSATQSILVGHVDPRRGWVVEASFARPFTAGADQTLSIELRGTVVTVSLNGSVVGSYAYNAAVADGRVGALSRTGTTSYDRFRFRTDDLAFAGVVLPPEIRVSDATVVEGATGTTTLVNVTLQLTRAVTAPATVSWTTEPGSATAGVDYIAASGTATFAAGSTTAVIQVAVVGDGAGEGNETFRVVLTSWAGFNLADGAGVVTITNDDPLPALAVSVTDGSGSEQGSDPVRFVVNRVGNLEGDVTVGLAWTGMATLGSDYTVSVTGGTLSADRRVLTLASGVSTATITVTPVDDTAVEGPESVVMTLLSGVGYTLGTPSSGSGSIADNDGASVTVSVGNAAVNEGSKGSTRVSVTVTLSAASASTVTVNYATVAGTATAGVDYQSASGTLTFKPGVTSLTIGLTVYGDKVVEPDETFTVVLSNAVNAVIGTGVGVVTIRNDDQALMADAAPAGATSPASLTQAQLARAVDLARSRWLAVAPWADFTGISVTVEDLDGAMLGHNSGKEITIDATAAGWGWSVRPGAPGVDLVAVVMHELGHAFGLDHDDAGTFSVMAPSLGPSQPGSAVLWAGASKRVTVGPLRALLATPGPGAGRPALTPLAPATPLRLAPLMPQRVAPGALGAVLAFPQEPLSNVPLYEVSAGFAGARPGASAVTGAFSWTLQRWLRLPF